MDEHEQFFYDHAGFAFDQATETAEQARERNARELREAELWAIRNGYNADWPDDEDGQWDGDVPLSDDAVGPFGCVLRGPDGEVAESLWCIYLNARDDPYRRVVEAELASEAKRRMEADAAMLASTPELRAIVQYAAAT